MLYAPAGGGKVIAFNGSGRAPKRATVDWYLDTGLQRDPDIGSPCRDRARPRRCLVPDHRRSWTRRPRRVAAAGDPLCRGGLSWLHDRVAFDWANGAAERLAEEHAARHPVLPGRPHAPRRREDAPAASWPRPCARSRNKGRTDSIRPGRRGHGGASQEPRRPAYARGFRRDQGRLCGAGLRPPIAASTIYQMPPNNQGLTALLMLNILAGFELAGWSHRAPSGCICEIEAGRLAYRDRNALIGDPDHVRRASARCCCHRTMRTSCAPRSIRDPRHDATCRPRCCRAADTVYLTVVDRDRNAVSFINSIYYSFGSGVVAPKSGVMLQNRGASFRLDPKHPNAIAPGKRPMHTIMPGMALRDGRAVMPFGVMGGDYQPFGHVQLLTNMLDFGMDPQAGAGLPARLSRSRQGRGRMGLPGRSLTGCGPSGASPSAAAGAPRRRPGDPDRLGRRHADGAAPTRARMAARSAIEGRLLPWPGRAAIPFGFSKNVVRTIIGDHEHEFKRPLSTSRRRRR